MESELLVSAGCFLFALTLILAMLLAYRAAGEDGSDKGTPLDEW